MPGRTWEVELLKVTKDIDKSIRVQVVEAAKAHDHVLVVMLDVERPLLFHAIAHRDVVVGEVLELCE